MLITGLLFYKKIGVSKTIKLAVVICLFVIIGLKVFSYIGHTGVIFFDKPHRIMSFENVKSSFEIFIDQIFGYMGSFGFRSFTVYFFILSLVCMIIFFSNKKKWAFYE